MLLVYGVNYQKTPIHLREKIAFDEKELPLMLNQFMNMDPQCEAVILSTCSRTEIYTTLKNTDSLTRWLIQQKNLHDIPLSKMTYCYTDNDAIKHMMRVACGLDSAEVGEPQVFGQLKQAYFTAQNAGTTGVIFNQLFPAVFSATKHIRNETDIAGHSVSVAHMIVQVAKQYHSDLSEGQVMLVGAGEMIQLIAAYLHGVNVKNIFIANRSLEKSHCISESVQAKSIQIHDIPAELPHIDIMITATASQLPLIGKGLIETVLKQRKQKPLLLFDLAVPRDIEPEVGALENVFLFNIDDVQKIIADHRDNQLSAAIAAEKMIDSHTRFITEKMRIFNARHVIARYRERLEKMRDDELQKALRLLRQGCEPVQVLEQFGHALINKMMHHPTMKLREAASMEACEAMQTMKEFFLAER